MKTILILLLLLTIGTYLRFYNLNWGAPFYFHPDERNIASSVSQLSFPVQMNPHFFAYGSLPIYAIYFAGLFFRQHIAPTVPFELAIYISRLYSALLSVLSILMAFFLGKKIKNNTTGILSALFATFCVGFIQFAHFGTFEIWLTFFSLLFCLANIYLYENPNIWRTIICGIILGILISIKVSSLALFPIPLLILLINRNKRFYQRIMPILVIFCLSALVFAITNPFVLFSRFEFRNSMQYESYVALGTLQVFYTGEFFHSIPILYQMLYIFPFILNPFIAAVSILSILITSLVSIKNRDINLFILALFFWLLFLSQAFFFAKWTRYMIPVIPFLLITTAYVIEDILYNFRKTGVLLISFLTITSITFSFAYIITAFIQQDTRLRALEWAKTHISSNANIISEVYDLGITPFNSSFPLIQLANTYDLDNGSNPYPNLSKIDAIVLPSQRVEKIRLSNNQKFPRGNYWYKNLFSGSFGFYNAFKTPCDIWCRITYLGDPVNRFEETANIFDRPTLYIFLRKS